MIKKRALNFKYLLIFIFLISLVFVSDVNATDYYINATTGADSNNGTGPATPWKTIAMINNHTFNPGDNLYFERGQTWRENLTVQSSGNASDQITFGAYGSGEKPIINGADNVTGWDNLSSSLGFDRCQNIIISSAASSTLSNFPVYLNITYDSDMLSDFSDLRFHNAACWDSGSELDYEIENYTNIKADVWIKLPSLPSSGKTISMYYKNNTGVSSGENPTGVWDGNYRGVWHMTEINANDSTGVNNGTQSGGVTYTSSGKVDGADFFAGDDDYVEVNDHSSIHFDNLTSRTIGFWMKAPSTGHSGNNPRVISKGDNYYLYKETGQDMLKLYIYDGTTVGGIGITGIWDNQWHHVAMVVDRSDQKIYGYVDGELNATDTDISDVGNTSTTNALWFGGDSKWGNEFLNGTIDEVRISNTTRSADWINQTYQLIENQGTYISFGVEIDHTNIWNASLTTAPNMVFFNGTKGTNVSYTELDFANEWNWTSNMLYVYSTSDPDTAYTNPGIEATVRTSCIDTNVKSYLTFDGIRVERATTNGFLVNTNTSTRPSNITIQNSEVYWQDQYGITIGNSGATHLTPNNVTIDNTTISDWFRSLQVAPVGTITSPAIFQLAGDGSGGDNLIVRNCTIESDLAITQSNNDRNGIHILTGDNILIEYNEINQSEHGIFIQGNESGNAYAETYTIRYNYIHNTTDDAIWLKETDQTDSAVYYNIIYNTGDNGIHLQSSSTSYGSYYNNIIHTTLNAAILIIYGCENTNFKNNIIYNYGTSGGDEAYAIKLSTGTSDLDGSDFNYNTFYKSGDSTPFLETTLGGRALAQWQSDMTQEANSLNSDPLFYDASANNFTLNASSPCIDAGTNVSLTQDYNGISVPLGGGPDIGVYEYNDTVVPTITFSCSPTSVRTGRTITCSCTATDTVDSSPSVSYTVNPSTSSTGTHTTTCTAIDDAGNSATSDISYTVSSSSSAGTPSFYTNTIVQDDKEFSEVKSITRELKKKERIRIKIDNKEHYVGVTELTETTATIEISSTSQKTVFNISDEKKFDVTDDNYYDIYIKLNSIVNDKANLTIKSIYEEIPEIEKKKFKITDEETKWFYFIIALVIVIVVIVGIGYRKKKRYNKKKRR